MSETDLRLHAAITSHDLFFSHIISMIPRDLYKPEEEEDVEGLNKRYHKHRKLPLALDEKKLISKKKIKEKYEPKEEAEDPAPPLNEDFSLPAEDLGLEGLKQRLQERILSLRASRGGDGSKNKQKSAANSQQKSKSEKKSTNFSNKPSNLSSPSEVVSARSIREELINHNDDDGAGDDDYVDGGVDREGEGDIEYSKFIESSTKSNEPGKPGSKTKRLQRMLEEADRKRQRIEELTSQGKEGKERIRAEQWSEVIQEAAGEKVLINTIKIKKALKRREKTKEKSAVQWQERLSEVEATKAKRQEKREENILKRKSGSMSASSLATDSSNTKPKEGKKITGPGGGSSNHPKKSDGHKSSAPHQQRAGFEGKKKEFLNKSK